MIPGTNAVAALKSELIVVHTTSVIGFAKNMAITDSARAAIAVSLNIFFPTMLPLFLAEWLAELSLDLALITGTGF